MSSISSPLPPPRRAVIVAVLCALAPGVQAQQDSGDGSGSDEAMSDQIMVVARTVQPRIAYRGIPRDDNPVRVQATTFPGRVFHAALDASVERLVGDGELAQSGSVGIDGGAALHRALTGGQPTGLNPAMPGGAGSSAAAPLGAGASPGAAVSVATRGLGNLIQASVLPVLTSTSGGGE